MESAISSTVCFDLTQVGHAEVRARLENTVRMSGGVDEESNAFWNDFLVDAASSQVARRTLVIADLARIVRHYLSVGPRRWLTSVRRARPYFIALVRTRHDERLSSLIDDLMRHSDSRLAVCRGLDWKGEMRDCLNEALAAFDPEAVVAVRYSHARENGLWVEFGDGLSGFVAWEDMGMGGTIDSLVAESAMVGSRGRTIELTARDGDLFEIDSAAVRMLLDRRFALEIAIRARTSDETVGARVRDARKAAGLTQVELGERADLDQAVLSRLERGKHQPRVDTLTRIAAALDMSLSGLLAYTTHV